MDYGAISDNNYVTASSALINFQVGNATVEKKVAGDSCVNCHGATRMHLEGAHPHNVPFETDACNACHDYSGGYADVLNNRVHAVHAASKTGDAVEGGPIPWDHVTYPLGLGWPGGIGRCAICHSSTNGAADTVPNASYRTNVKEVTCYGCHADRPGAVDHMMQSGGVDFSPNITP